MMSARRLNLRLASWLVAGLASGIAHVAYAQERTPSQGLAAPDAPDAPSNAPDAKTLIESIRVEVEDTPLGKPVLPTIRSARAGDVYTAAVGRRILREALDTGLFAGGEIALQATGDRVAVVVRLRVRNLIEDVHLELGGLTFTREEVLREADIAIEGEIVADSLTAVAQKLTKLCKKHGFESASVTSTLRPGKDPLHAILVLAFSHGRARVIDKRVFESVDRSSELRALYDTYLPRKGVTADEVLLDTADVDLQNKLRGRGFHDALVSHVLEHDHEQLQLRVRIALGARYTLRFSGADHYDDTALLGALALEQETDRSLAHLAEKLRAFFVARGFLDAEVGIRDLIQGNLHTLAFRILEHERVAVTTRYFPCFHSEAIAGPTHDTAPISAEAIGNEIDSFLEDELPGADLLRSPNVQSLDMTLRGEQGVRGTRALPVELNPTRVYSPDSYARAADHLRELYRADGYLAATVGPVELVRHACSRFSPPGECLVVAASPKPDICNFDTRGTPVADPAPDPSSICTLSDGKHQACEVNVRVKVPVKLGPRTFLYDVVFGGVSAVAPKELLAVAALNLGTAASTTKLEQARKRVLSMYQELGYAYAQVQYALEPSSDKTRARVRFEVTEGQLVLVSGVIIRGNAHTRDGLFRDRVALEVGKPFSTSRVQRTRERLAALGIFKSVDIALEDPFVPASNKRVVVTVVEQLSWFFEPHLGLSTGEGIRAGTEFGNRNLFGQAISLSLSAQASYLPTPFIETFVRDPTLRHNFVDILGDPGFDTRIAARVNATLQLPSVGLGPNIRAVLDSAFVHDLQRDYYVRKLSFSPTLAFVPNKKIRLTFGPSVEYSDSRIFAGSNIDEYYRTTKLDARQAASLLVPDGRSLAFAEKVTFAWDRRDDPLDPTSGTFYSASMEHVDGFPQDAANPGDKPKSQSHFLRVTQTVSGYIALYKRFRLALQLRLGANFQLTNTSSTYPDRLFFLGGIDSMRAWYPSSYVPQDDIDNIVKDQGKLASDTSKFTTKTHPVRGGDLMINPRIEFRIPVTGVFETAIFGDFGNLWRDFAYPFRAGSGLPPMRMSLGSGIRVKTIFPIALDVGWNPFRQTYDDIDFAVNFAIGLY